MSELLPMLKQRYLDDNGDPLAGGKLYSYAAGSVTPIATYTTQNGDVENANPIVLDADGEASVWISGGTYYKFILTDAADVVQWTVDEVSSPATAATAVGNTINNTAGGGTITALATEDNIQVITGTGATTIESMTAPSGGPKKIVVHNDTTGIVTIKHENSGSTALNRFYLPGAFNLSLGVSQSIEFFYDTADSRWKLIAGLGNDIPGTAQTIANNTTTGDVTGMTVDGASFLAAKIMATIRRTSDSPLDLAAYVEFNLYYDNATWRISGEVNQGDDVGVEFTVATSSAVAQVKYTSTNEAGASYTGVMRWKMIKL